MTETQSLTENDAPASSGGRSSRMRWIIAILAVVCIVVVARFVPLKGYFRNLLAWAEGLGVWGPIVVGAVYVPACVLFVPGSVLTLGAGALFGVVRGTIAVSIGSTLGATVAFILGRTVARGLIEKKVAANPSFAAVDAAVGREGFKIVLLTRLSPIFPFNLLNYGYGLTKVRLRDYFLASWIGMLPGTIMYVYIGSAIGSVAQVVAGGERVRTPGEWAMYGFGLIVTVVVTIYVTRVARRALKQEVPAVAEKSEEPKASSPASTDTERE